MLPMGRYFSILHQQWKLFDKDLLSSKPHQAASRKNSPHHLIVLSNPNVLVLKVYSGLSVVMGVVCW